MPCPEKQIENKDTQVFPKEGYPDKGLTKREYMLIEFTKAYISAGYDKDSIEMAKKTTELLLKEF